jgi:hypothetical protein
MALEQQYLDGLTKAARRSLEGDRRVIVVDTSDARVSIMLLGHVRVQLGVAHQIHHHPDWVAAATALAVPGSVQAQLPALGRYAVITFLPAS